MLTFTDLQSIVTETIGLSDTATVTKVKRDINRGGYKFLSALDREYNRSERTADLVSAQQYYQLPEDGLRLSEIAVSTGANGYQPPLEQIYDEHTWLQLNQSSTTGTPTHYYIKGFDEVGLYPIPSSSVTDGIKLVFEPKHILMTADDYSTGTVTFTNASQTVTGSSTVFTIAMQGRVLLGSDGRWYKISAYNSATSLTLENYYQGNTEAGASYRIGQVPNIPEEYHESLADYAVYCHYLRQKSPQASDFKLLFEEAVTEAKNRYSTTSTTSIVYAAAGINAYNPWRGDALPPGSIT